MTVYYVDNAGSNTSPYDTWAKAANNIATIAAIDSAGDTIYVASTHTESTAGNINLDWAGTSSSPTEIICGTTAAAPPTTYAQTASIAVTGNVNIAVNTTNAGNAAIHGVVLTAGATTNNANVRLAVGVSSSVVAQDCELSLGGSSNNSRVQLSAATGAVGRAIDCTFNFSSTAQKIGISGNGASGLIEGGSIKSGSSAITDIFEFSSPGTFLLVSGFDVSNAAAAANMCSTTQTGVRFLIRDSKLPSSWSGSLNASTPGDGAVFEMHNCDSGDTHYNYARSVSGGTIVDETTLVKTGGATDADSTTISWRVDTGTNATDGFAMRTEEIMIDNSTVGSSVTVTLDILHDSVTNLTNAEIWLEVMSLNTSGVPLGSWTRDDVAGDNSGNRLATAADQASSAATWTTTGMTNPNTQKLSVTFTPQETGYIIGRVACSKASYTLYIDPVLQLA